LFPLEIVERQLLPSAARGLLEAGDHDLVWALMQSRVSVSVENWWDGHDDYIYSATVTVHAPECVRKVLTGVDSAAARRFEENFSAAITSLHPDRRWDRTSATVDEDSFRVDADWYLARLESIVFPSATTTRQPRWCLGYFADWRDRRFECVKCQRSMTAEEMRRQDYPELTVHTCPGCNTTVLLILAPTQHEAEEAAKRGNPEAAAWLLHVGRA